MNLSLLLSWWQIAVISIKLFTPSTASSAHYRPLVEMTTEPGTVSITKYIAIDHTTMQIRDFLGRRRQGVSPIGISQFEGIFKGERCHIGDGRELFTNIPRTGHAYRNSLQGILSVFYRHKIESYPNIGIDSGSIAKIREIDPYAEVGELATASGLPTA
jgi:hypothetical protein